MSAPAHAPIHLTVSPGWQWGFGVFHFAVALLVIVLAARGPVRSRDWAELRFRWLVLFGAALGAAFFEGAVDRAGGLWYAVPGQWKMIAACYMCYGAVTWPVVAAMHDGLGKLDTTLAAFLTMGLGPIAVYVSANVAPRLRHAMDWYGTTTPAAIPAATTAPTSSERELAWQP